MVIVASVLSSVLALGAGPNLAGNSYFVAAQGGGGSFNNSMWPSPIEDLGHIWEIELGRADQNKFVARDKVKQ